MASALLAGVDFSNIQMGQGDQITLPDPVEGRIVHIDADFLAYYFSYVKPDETITWEEMKQNAEGHIHLIKSLAAATKIHLHLTPSSSDKGDRHALAQLKEYQANRKADGKPEYLHVMRE